MYMFVCLEFQRTVFCAHKCLREPLGSKLCAKFTINLNITYKHTFFCLINSLIYLCISFKFESVLLLSIRIL